MIITPTRIPGAWHLDVGSRDRRGLLAAYTGVLADRGMDVKQAVLATWIDGGALEAFVVSSTETPEPNAFTLRQTRAQSPSLESVFWCAAMRSTHTAGTGA